jgi:hypothetical protein
MAYMPDALRPNRRTVIGGLAAATAGRARIGDAVAAAVPDPDLGPNVLVFDPAMPAAAIQAKLDTVFRTQERAHFTDARYAILFKAGRYAVDVNVGFFTQVAGLGVHPDDVTIDGHVHAEADWANGMDMARRTGAIAGRCRRPPPIAACICTATWRSTTAAGPAAGSWRTAVSTGRSGRAASSNGLPATRSYGPGRVRTGT